MGEPRVEARFVRWSGARALLHRGWWLVASIYLVVDANLSPSQLVVIGIAQAVIGLVAEIPAGVLADTVSRKWSLVLSHGLMGAAMLATGLVASFPALLVTQMCWGLAWCFASGAEVAWVTDELDQPARVGFVLATAARAQLTGSAIGLVLLGSLAAATSLVAGLVAAGAAMVLLGAYVAWGFPETHFTPARTRRLSASLLTLRQGSGLVRRSPELATILAATILVNGGATAGRLYPARLLDVGFPTAPDVIVWFTALGVVTLLLGALVLRVVERRVGGEGVRRQYAAASGAGALGVALLAAAHDPAAGSIAVLLFAGLAMPLTRLICTVWANTLTGSRTRATVHSFLAQAEYLGVITCGTVIAGLASLSGLPRALVVCASLFALAAALVGRSRRSPPSDLLRRR